MRVQELVTDAVQTTSPAAAAVVALERMRRLQIHHLAVTDGGRLVGVLNAAPSHAAAPHDASGDGHLVGPGNPPDTHESRARRRESCA